MTKNELIKAFLHRLSVIYTPFNGKPMKYNYIEAIEYTTDRFGVFKLGVTLRGRGNTITHVLAERVEVEDEKERENANSRPCPFEMPESFDKYKKAFISCSPVLVKDGGTEKFYPRISKLTVKLDYYGEIIFTVTVGKNTGTKEYSPEDVTITNYKSLIGVKEWMY